MHRNWFNRGFTGVMSVWLVICIAEPAQLHTCAMHGGLAIGAGHSANSHAAATHHSAAHHAAPASDAVSSHSHHDQNKGSHSTQCNCLGDCSVGKSPLTLPGTAERLQVLVTGSSTAVAASASPIVVAAHFLLPFANGPPGFSSRA